MRGTRAADTLRRMPAARFVTDASLEFLARRLRFLGYDVETHRGARLEELLEHAVRSGRTVLTLSARHPRRLAAAPVVRVRREDPAGALRRIAETHAATGPPFSRCPACNVALRERQPFEARGEVPANVARAGGPLRYCPTCGKWYWEGSHVARIRAWLEQALGRPLEDAPAPGGA